MNPTSIFTGPSALGLTGTKKGKPLASLNVVTLTAGVVYLPFEVPDERRGGVFVLGLNALPFPKPSGATHVLSNRTDSRLTGLFPLGADYPGCFVGGYPKDGPEKDRDAFLVKWTPERLTVYVFANFGHDKTVLVQAWKDGRLEGVESPKGDCSLIKV